MKFFFEKIFFEIFFEIFFDPCPLKEGGGVRGVRLVTGETGVTGVTGVVRLTRGRYPPSDLECLSPQDSENIAHCLSDSVIL